MDCTSPIGRDGRAVGGGFAAPEAGYPGLMTITDKLENFEPIDKLSSPLQDVVSRAVPDGSRLKDALSGTWLQHPVHPPLTDVVIGSWLSGLAVDVFGGRDGAVASRRLVGLGILAALPTAATGASDWSDLIGKDRRLGSIHAIANTTALAAQSLSWLQRRRGHRGTGIALSLTAVGISSAAAWIGGHLSYGRAVGVNHTAFEDGPEEWTRVLDASELADGELTGGLTAEGFEVLLVKQGERIHAIADRCAHMGCPLHEGELDGHIVRCGCHGSEFTLEGALVHGPATSGQPRFEARIAGDSVEVRKARA
jgi:nitrite reductase/ring-hydroxylating ferredoxin subunit